MASFQAFLLLAATSFLIHTTESANHVIRWGSGTTDPQSWASSQSFRTGDTVTFSYGSSHNVVEVTKAEYDACTTKDPIATATGGSTAVKLPSPGRRYFVCGVLGHCGAGMKVTIGVASASAVITTTPSTSPSIPPSEENNTATATSPPDADSTETAPVPQESGANCPAAFARAGTAAGFLMLMLI